MGSAPRRFKGTATIVYNRAQWDELRRKGGGYIELFKQLVPGIAPVLAEVKFVDPDLTYDGEVTIDLGGHRAVLRSVGPAHSAGDQMVFIDNRVLFAGDLLETRMFSIFPYFPPLDADVDGSRWIGLLDEMIASKPDIVVPGHGEVSDTTLVHAVREYQEDVALNQKARELYLQSRAVNRLRLLITTFTVFSVLSIVLASATGVSLLQVAACVSE